MPSKSSILRVMTYNIHKCLGRDKKHRPDRIIEVIQSYRPDIIALQEVDVGYKISGGIDQAEFLAEQLNMHSHFQPAITDGKRLYGNMLISRFPFQVVRHQTLPDTPVHKRVKIYERVLSSTYEPRCAFWADVDADGLQLQVMVTHLGLPRKERARQVELLLSDEWLRSESLREQPVLLLGDFNDGPGSKLYRDLKQHLRDAQGDCAGHRHQKTFMSWWPLRCLDHIFFTEHLKVDSVNIPVTPLVRIASDHLPVVADFQI